MPYSSYYNIDQPVYRKRVLEFTDEDYLVEHQKWRVDDIMERGDGWSELIVWLRRGDVKVSFPLGTLEHMISEDPRWLRKCEHEAHPLLDEDTGTIQIPKSYDELPKPESVNDLHVVPLGGEGARETVNHFLEGWYDGRVEHALGAVKGWKAAFGAYYGDFPISMIVLGHHMNHKVSDKHLVIDRIASHPNRPHNTSTWLIARARRWARDKGFEKIITYAGVGDNEGVCYKAAGFERNDDYTETVEEESLPESSRKKVRDDTWTRTRWEYELA